MRTPFGLLLAVSLCAAAPQAAEQAIGIQLTGARLVRTPPPGLIGPRVIVDTETEFLTTDPGAWYVVTYTGGHKDVYKRQTCHSAGWSPQRRIRQMSLIAENVRRYAGGLPLMNVVDKVRGY